MYRILKDDRIKNKLGCIGLKRINRIKNKLDVSYYRIKIKWDGWDYRIKININGYLYLPLYYINTRNYNFRVQK